VQYSLKRLKQCPKYFGNSRISGQAHSTAAGTILSCARYHAQAMVPLKSVHSHGDLDSHQIYGPWTHVSQPPNQSNGNSRESGILKIPGNFQYFPKLSFFLHSILQHYLKVKNSSFSTCFCIIWVKSRELNTSSRPMFITAATNYQTTALHGERNLLSQRHTGWYCGRQCWRYCRATFLTTECWPVHMSRDAAEIVGR